ncbi:MAG TPA: iron-containing redox enzyme family protein [Polyangiaceae bacterium]|jgi:pyrroloquinoline quinone (PQQ) biosynthesis protein C
MTIGNLPIIGRAWAPSEKRNVLLPIAATMAFGPDVRADAERQEIVVGPGRGEPWDVMSFRGEGAEEAFRYVMAVDGTRSIADVAREVGGDVDEATAVLQELYERAVLRETGGVELPAVVFYEHLRMESKRAFDKWGPSPMLARFASGPVTRRFALGYLMENYHYAAAASSHQGAAVASMPTLRLKTAFSEHLSIEYWHHAWLKRGLLAAGLTEQDVERAHPLPSTLAQINQLRWLAVSDPLAYSACIGIGEGDPMASSSVARFWDRFAEHGVLPEEAYGPFREHDLGDCEDDHESFGSEAFIERGGMTATEQARVRARVLSFSRLTWGFHHEMVDFYGSAEGPAFFTPEG